MAYTAIDNSSSVEDASFINNKSQLSHVTASKPTIRRRPMIDKTYDRPHLRLQVDDASKLTRLTLNDHISIDEIHRIVEDVVHITLDDKQFDDKHVLLWCKEISNGLRDRLKTVTRNKRKVVATTYIGSKTNGDGAHVNVKCQKHMNMDDFITVALEGEDMFVWVTLLLSDYGR